MPLSLLLTQQLSILTEGVRKLDPWAGIVDTFGLVARRLRSVWLVRWFGTAVPVTGIDIRVSIANIDELQARYAAVTRAGRGASSGGPNLMEPLLGMGGAVAGALAAPLNGMVVVVLATKYLQRWWQQMVLALGWLSGGGLISILLSAAAPLVVLGVLAQGVGGGAADTYDLLGALAAMALPLQRLWDQLAGRAPVRNPLLRQLLVLGDSLAGLLAQLLGFVAVAVTRIAPVVAPLLAAARATMDAVHAIVGAIGAAVGDVRTFLRMFMTGPYAASAVVGSVTVALRGLGRRLRLLVTTTLREMATVALSRVGGTLFAVALYAVEAAYLVARVVFDSPFVRWLESVRDLAATYSAWSSRPGGSPSSSSSSSSPSPWVTSFPVPASARALATGLAHRPSLSSPALSAPPLIGPGLIPPIARAMGAGLLPEPADPFALGTAQRSALRRFSRQPSVVGELRALEERQGHAAGAARSEVFALADVLAEVEPRLQRTVAALAPEQSATLLPRIEGVLAALDRQLRRHPGDHPTADLPEPDTVRPVVGRLVIRAAQGQSSEDLRAFVASLRGQLDARTYAVPQGAR